MFTWVPIRKEAVRKILEFNEPQPAVLATFREKEGQRAKGHQPRRQGPPVALEPSRDADSAGQEPATSSERFSTCASTTTSDRAASRRVCTSSTRSRAKPNRRRPTCCSSRHRFDAFVDVYNAGLQKCRVGGADRTGTATIREAAGRAGDITAPRYDQAVGA